MWLAQVTEGLGVSVQAQAMLWKGTCVWAVSVPAQTAVLTCQPLPCSRVQDRLPARPREFLKMYVLFLKSG